MSIHAEERLKSIDLSELSISKINKLKRSIRDNDEPCGILKIGGDDGECFFNVIGMNCIDMAKKIVELYEDTIDKIILGEDDVGVGY